MRWHQDSKLTINVSKKKWVEGESNGVELGWEGSTDGDTDLDKAYAEKYDELDALADKFLDSNPTIEDVASALGAEVTLADVAQANREKGFKDVHVEEPPPLPSEAAEEVRTPIAENGDELVSFLVESFEIAESNDRNRKAKVFGGPVRQHGASAWHEIMEPLIDISDMDVGQKFKPPYPVKAWCTKSTKGYPNVVQYFEKA
jgi:hypothetical protein